MHRLLTLALSFIVGNALAWGTQGHQTIAAMAAAQLSADAKLEMDRLLALEPGATMASLSTWADEHRSPTTAPWHYVNFPRDSCAFEAQRDCPDGACVVAAIARQSEVLASNAGDDKRLHALKYIVHFVADIHQPLHAGYLEDRGGNSVALQTFMRASNLHALWDSGLLSSLSQDNASLAARLLAKRVPASEVDPARVAEESCRIVGMPGFYPDRRVGTDYVERFTPVMELRMAQAAARLAGLLNRLLRPNGQDTARAGPSG